MKAIKAIICVVALSAFVGFCIKSSIEAKQTEETYQRAVQLVMDEQYHEASRTLWSLPSLDYKDTWHLLFFSSIGEEYQENFAGVHHVRSDFRITFDTLPPEQEQLIQSRLLTMSDAYDRKREKELSDRQAEKERKIRNGVPFVGMSESRIGDTSLGAPSPNVGHNYQVKNGSQYYTNIYRFYRNGKEIFSARCMEGKVIDVWDWRGTTSSSSSGYSSSSSSSSDKYDASSYSNEDDFYDDYYDDFYDYYDAEEYWQENH